MPCVFCFALWYSRRALRARRLIPYKHRRDILGVVSVLIFGVLGVQAFISTHLVSGELERSVTANMTSKAQATVDTFDGLLQSVAADMTVIGAHKAIENYLTFRVFGDDDGMTESVSELELFLARVFRGKPHYTHMRLADRDAVVLHMESGIRVEKYESYDRYQVFKSVEENLQKGDPLVSHAIRNQGEKVMLLFMGAVVIENKIEGLIWLFQPLEGALQALFSGAADSGLSVVVSSGDGGL